MGAIGAEDGVGVDGHVVAELLDHGAELVGAGQVLVSAVQPDVVLALQVRPDRLLAVGRAAVRGLEACVEAAELLADLRTAVGRVVVEAEVGLLAAVGVPEGAGQLDQEPLEAHDVRRRGHHELGCDQAAADGTV